VKKRNGKFLNRVRHHRLKIADTASASGVELHREQQLREEKSSSEGHSGIDHQYHRLSEKPVSTGVLWVVFLFPS
jgi:hypothetical protein